MKSMSSINRKYKIGAQVWSNNHNVMVTLNGGDPKWFLRHACDVSYKMVLLFFLFSKKWFFCNKLYNKSLPILVFVLNLVRVVVIWNPRF